MERVSGERCNFVRWGVGRGWGEKNGEAGGHWMMVVQGEGEEWGDGENG
jgi:hypothetical protein